ncbi:hypothetical protein [Microbacterium oxydans]|uniref:hypothetical protein n=1 Tax=Microbacterium oxydans TaxID=82380 RepID=UPI00226B2C32|nr:hypothetical protein [Microbacterium oxydans]WAA67780.1 hypothetical protein MME74_08500 [Microbacterium oxydans]
MTNIKYPEGPAPELTAANWEHLLGWAEETAALGEDDGEGMIVHNRADGSRTIVFRDSLDWLREQVAEERADVAELEAMWDR